MRGTLSRAQGRKPGETIFSGARVEGDGRFTTSRVAVSKDGIEPPQ